MALNIKTTFEKAKRGAVASSVAATAALAGSALTAQGAAADEYGKCRDGAVSGCIPENGSHYYCEDNDFRESSQLIFAGRMVYLGDATDMDDHFQSCTSGTDAVPIKADVPGAIIGDYKCRAPSKYPENRICNRACLLVDEDQIYEDYEAPQSAISALMCHEIGHSVGLAHGPNQPDCMTDIGNTPDTFSVHHKNHVNFIF